MNLSECALNFFPTPTMEEQPGLDTCQWNGIISVALTSQFPGAKITAESSVIDGRVRVTLFGTGERMSPSEKARVQSEAARALDEGAGIASVDIVNLIPSLVPDKSPESDSTRVKPVDPKDWQRIYTRAGEPTGTC